MGLMGCVMMRSYRGAAFAFVLLAAGAAYSMSHRQSCELKLSATVVRSGDALTVEIACVPGDPHGCFLDNLGSDYVSIFEVDGRTEDAIKSGVVGTLSTGHLPPRSHTEATPSLGQSARW